MSLRIWNGEIGDREATWAQVIIWYEDTVGVITVYFFPWEGINQIGGDVKIIPDVDPERPFNNVNLIFTIQGVDGEARMKILY